MFEILDGELQKGTYITIKGQERIQRSAKMGKPQFGLPCKNNDGVNGVGTWCSCGGRQAYCVIPLYISMITCFAERESKIDYVGPSLH